MAALIISAAAIFIGPTFAAYAGAPTIGDPPLDGKIGKRAASHDLALVDVRLSDAVAASPKYENSHLWARATVKNLAGIAPCFHVATTGDSSTPDGLFKSDLMRLGAGQSTEVRL